MMPVVSDDDARRFAVKRRKCCGARRCYPRRVGQPIDPAELVERCAEVRRELEHRWQRGLHREAGVAALELVDCVAALRRSDATREAIDAASGSIDVLGVFARTHPRVYLPALARMIDQLGRCFEHLGEYAGAAAAFGSAVEAQKILLGTLMDPADDDDHDDLREHLQLIDLLSRQAVALAQSGELAQAHARALEFIALARDRLPQALPQLGGGLVFMADLATELGRPQDAVVHLSEGFERLDDAAAQHKPGARDAAARVASRLLAAAHEAGVALPPVLIQRLVSYR